MLKFRFDEGTTMNTLCFISNAYTHRSESIVCAIQWWIQDKWQHALDRDPIDVLNVETVRFTCWVFVSRIYAYFFLVFIKIWLLLWLYSLFLLLSFNTWPMFRRNYWNRCESFPAHNTGLWFTSDNIDKRASRPFRFLIPRLGLQLMTWLCYE